MEFYAGANILLLLEYPFILSMDFSDLHTMLLPKLPLVDLQNALPSVILFHPALFLIKELFSQQTKVWQWAHPHETR